MPYQLIGPDRSPELISNYRSLLKDSIFPAIDTLLSKGLIDNYHFLTHFGLDLRISVINPDDLSEVKKVLAEYGLPTDMKSWDLEHNRIEAEDDILRLNTEITRLLLGHPNLDDFYPSVVHYQNNSFGMGNVEEVNFHLSQAINWLFTIYVNSGIEKQEAFERAKSELIKVLGSYGLQEKPEKNISK